MAYTPLPSLIDKQDYFEIIRDQIAVILAEESANQQALAIAAGEDPELWRLDVYTERSNPWEKYLNQVDAFPIVNVWVDNLQFDMSKGNPIERQMSNTVFNIDMYGYGRSADNPAGGHFAGDELSAKETQRALRLVRNILMSAQNTYLQLQGVVGRRWPQSINFFQPQIEVDSVQHVQGARLALDVQHNELSPQAESVILEGIDIEVKRAEDGQVLAEATYDYPITP